MCGRIGEGVCVCVYLFSLLFALGCYLKDMLLTVVSGMAVLWINMEKGKMDAIEPKYHFNLVEKFRKVIRYSRDIEGRLG